MSESGRATPSHGLSNTAISEVSNNEYEASEISIMEENQFNVTFSKKPIKFPCHKIMNLSFQKQNGKWDTKNFSLEFGETCY